MQRYEAGGHRVVGKGGAGARGDEVRTSATPRPCSLSPGPPPWLLASSSGLPRPSPSASRPPSCRSRPIGISGLPSWQVLMRALSLFALSACSKMLGAMDDVQLLDAAVDGDTTPPAIADFSSSRSVPVAGETLSITLTLDKAAPESGQMITLDVDPDVIAAPVQLTIPAAESSTRFDAYPLRPSARFTIRAHAGESTKELELRIGGLEVAEVLADPAGADDRLQWVKLHNRTSLPIDLLNYRLKAGQASYNFTDMVLVGVIPAGGCFVFGGPVVSALNGDPTFSYAVDFTPDLPHGGTQA